MPSSNWWFLNYFFLKPFWMKYFNNVILIRNCGPGAICGPPAIFQWPTAYIKTDIWHGPQVSANNYQSNKHKNTELSIIIFTEADFFFGAGGYHESLGVQVYLMKWPGILLYRFPPSIPSFFPDDPTWSWNLPLLFVTRINSCRWL